MKTERDVQRQGVLEAICPLLLLVLCFLVAWFRFEPPLLDRSLPETSFSATRAAQRYAQLLGPERPHPVGSTANVALRGALEKELASFGYVVEVQRAFSCDRRGVCADVENVIALPRGLTDRTVTLLVAHYDSVPAGPGGADDGSGVAIALECAALLRAESPRHPFAFLLTDGEEAGLLGARAFAQSHPLSRRLHAVVNVEARGTSGPSLLFETSGHGAELVRTVARSAARPFTTSLYAEVYKRLPNDTDFSIFKKAGVPGVNFAFIGDYAHYHTPSDSLAVLDLNTLQHQGGQALNALRTLAEHDANFGRDRDDTFFDVAGLFVVAWPSPATLPLALLAIAGGSLAIILAIRRGARLKAIALAAAGSLVAPLLAAIAAVAVTALLRAAGAMPAPSIATQWPANLAVVLVAVALTLFAQRARWSVSERASGCVSALIVWTLVVLLAAPGAAYLFILLLLSMALSLLVKANEPWLLALPAIVSGLIVLPLTVQFHSGLGTGALAPIAFIAALSILPAIIAAAEALPRRTPLIGLAAAALLLVGQSLMNPFSARTPQHGVVMEVVDSDGHTGRRVALFEGKLPPDVARAARWTSAPQQLFPWSSRSDLLTSAFDPPRLRPPSARIVGERRVGGGRVFDLHLRSERAAARLGMSTPAADRIRAVEIDGQRLDPRTLRTSAGWFRCVNRTAETRSVTLRLDIQGSEPFEFVVDDQSFELTELGARIAASRGPRAVPAHDGDLLVVTKRFRL